jgi:hypothetical protein
VKQYLQQKSTLALIIYDPQMIMSSYTTNDYVPNIV